MAGRRVLLILSLVLALRTTAGAQSLPLIVQIYEIPAVIDVIDRRYSTRLGSFTYNQEGNSLTSPIFQPVRGIPGFELGILRPYRVL